MPKRMPLWPALAALLVTGAVLAAAVGCDWTDPPLDSDADSLAHGRILDVRVEPSPLAAGDTASFTVVLADSARPTDVYRWYLAGVAPVVVTTTNQVAWAAPGFGDTFHHSVTVEDTVSQEAPSTTEFAVEVVEVR